LKLVNFVKQYWVNRGLLGLGHRVTVEALARADAKVRTVTRSRTLVGAGQLCCVMGRYEEAQGYLEESLSIARDIGDQSRIAAVLQPLALALLGQGNAAAARTYLEEALALARELGNPREIAAAQNALAQVRRVEGALDAAEPLYQQMLTLARELGDHELVAIGLLNLAMVAVGRESGARAATMLIEVLAIAEEIGSKPAGQSALDVCAGLGALRAEWDCAVRFYGAAEAQSGHTGLRRDPADEAFLAPRIAAAREALGASAFSAAESAGRALSYEQSITEARAWLEKATSMSESTRSR
jgi:tetratricopeptide (TPR) repeat protein